MNTVRRCLAAALLLVLQCLPSEAQSPFPFQVGVAQIDVTPDYPVRLNGFGFRREESEGVTHPIWAKALAIKDPVNGPAVVITLDNLGVPAVMTQEVARRLQAAFGLNHQRLAITASHTHTAPMLTPVAPTLFGQPIPTDHQKHIDRYTRELTDRLEEVALAALKDLRPGRLEWTTGEVVFAKNRRTAGGPVDHDLPMMVVRDEGDSLRGIWFNYACHCVTLSDNKISGDWAGSAQIAIQQRHPNAVVLASIGCGADQNPDSGVTGGQVAVADAQGNQIADEVDRLLGQRLKPLTGPLTIKLAGVPLAFDTPRARSEWVDRAQQDNAIGHHARVNLARIDRGETLPDHIDYPIQTWLFGDELAMVFLPGEVVVDYSLRLKKEFDRRRLWINAYANDAPCYIPSERILQEGGYEGGDAMIYYDQPNRFAPGLEQQIIDVIHEQIPDEFKVPEGTDGSAPRSPEASLRSLRVRPGMEVELIASEPLIVDPVAIDWGPDGRLWVVEMNDYPLGMQGGYEPGGRIKVLEDTDDDGQYDNATVFVDGLAFPTGITVWGNGALISAAPDLIYAEDTDGDGRADKRETWFTGFATANHQARINSISLGLDNWLYGANGLIGGNIRPVALADGPAAPTGAISIRNHDFRFDPWTGAFETVSGLTQQGRVRDDFGNWFGCDNGSLVFHFATDESLLRHNPFFIPPPARNFTWLEADANRLFPASTPLERYNDFDQLNRVTSACGLGIYRDELLGSQFSGNAFTCEPVHNLVRRTVLERTGNTFAGRRARDGQESEFLAATDQWFRPAQVRTGPDGAIWVVDMYRFLMEHPIWIRPARLTELDPRAGDRLGRIYRVYPTGQRPDLFRGFARGNEDDAGSPATPVDRLKRTTTAELTGAMASANGTLRDLAHQYLLHRRDTAAVPELERLAMNHSNPAVRGQSLCVLDGLKELTLEQVQRAVLDPHPGVRRQAARLAGAMVGREQPLARALVALLADPDAAVRTQSAGSLREATGGEVGTALGQFLLRNATDPYATAAAWSSALPHLDAIADTLLEAMVEKPQAAGALLPVLIQVAAGSGHESVTTRIARHIGEVGITGTIEPGTIRLLAELGESLGREALARWLAPPIASGPAVDSREGLKRVMAAARQMAGDRSAMPDDRLTAVRLLGWSRAAEGADLDQLLEILDESPSADMQTAVFNAFRHLETEGLADELLIRWDQATPGVRRLMIDVLLQRSHWTRSLLADAAEHPGQWQEIPSTRRSTLLHHEDRSIRDLAAALQEQTKPSGRADVLAGFQPAARLTGMAAHGWELFAQRCAACHLLDGIGRSVGPNLLELTDKSPEALMIAIIDPNRAVLDQYTVYELETTDGRSLAGVIAEESAAGLSLKKAAGELEMINRGAIRSTRATGLSLMPEGLEAGLSHQDMADLVAFIANARSTSEPPPRDPGVIAAYLLDDDQPSAEREAAVKVHYMLAPELLREMVRDLPVGTPEEYRRIPWIWRVAIQAGRRNETDSIGRLLDLSLPHPDEPLRDWQMVVIGGGLINGLSQIGVWPGERLHEILKPNHALTQRLERAVSMSSKLADDPTIPSGTRYDALRMVALGDPEAATEHLRRYLGADAGEELQMGPVSGLSDIRDARAMETLAAKLEQLTPNNQKLARHGMDRHRKNARE